MRWPDLSTYEGDFEDGKMEGKGIRKYSNGNIYEGQFSEDKAHGEGTFYKASDNTWKNGLWNMGKQQQQWAISGTKVRGSVSENGKRLGIDRKKNASTTSGSWKS